MLSIPRWVGRDVGRMVDVIRACENGIATNAIVMTKPHALNSLSGPVVKSIRASESLEDFPSTSSAMLDRVYLEVRPPTDEAR